LDIKTVDDSKGKRESIYLVKGKTTRGEEREQKKEKGSSEKKGHRDIVKGTGFLDKLSFKFREKVDGESIGGRGPS